MCAEQSASLLLCPLTSSLPESRMWLLLLKTPRTCSAFATSAVRQVNVTHSYVVSLMFLIGLLLFGFIFRHLGTTTGQAGFKFRCLLSALQVYQILGICTPPHSYHLYMCCPVVKFNATPLFSLISDSSLYFMWCLHIDIKYSINYANGTSICISFPRSVGIIYYLEWMLLAASLTEILQVVWETPVC